jgi:hypothetical protein
MSQQSVQVEGLAVHLVERDLVPEAKFSARLAESCKTIAVVQIHRLPEFGRIVLADELNNLCPAISQHDEMVHEGTALRRLLTVSRRPQSFQEQVYIALPLGVLLSKGAAPRGPRRTVAHSCHS